MTRIYETQTVTIDPRITEEVTINLDKDFDVLEMAVITNTLKAGGVREVTLGILYDDSVTMQHIIHWLTITVGNSIVDVTNQSMDAVNTLEFTNWIDHTIKDDEIKVTLISVYNLVGSADNQFSTKKVQLDPSNPITTGISFNVLGNQTESHLVNVGSLTKTLDVNSGTMNAVAIVLSADT